MKQGEIWLIDLNPTIGAEIKKSRPAVIVNDNSLGKLPLKIIVPVTEWKNKYKVAPWMIKVEPDKKNGLNKNSSIDCFQVRSVSQARFIRKLGIVSDSILDEIKIALSKVLSINS